MDKLKQWVDTLKGVFSLLRDFFLFIILVLLVSWPDGLNDRLYRAGFTNIHGPGFDWEARTKEAKQTSLAAAAAVDQSKEEIQALSAKLDTAVAADPRLEARVRPVRAALTQSNASLNAASEHLASTIAVQQTALHAANADASPLSGWIYLGTLDPAKTHWKGTDQTTNLNWPIEDGAMARIDTDAYVRAEGGGPTHSGGAFLGVAKTNSRVRIERTELGPPLADGRVPVWARVTVQQP